MLALLSLMLGFWRFAATEEHGALLVFDEVMTVPDCHGGAQEKFGIT